jgi:hypothetical protein
VIKKRRYIELPLLSGEQAYLLAFVLEESVKAIWGAHGDAMADFQGRAFPDEPSPFGSTTECSCPESDPDIPF